MKILKNLKIAERTLAFFLEKPEGFSFLPGQFIVLYLINPPEDDPKGNFRTFSIASAPFEDNLMISTRMGGSIFKKILNDLPEGTQVKIRGPAGSFILDERDGRPAVFLVGGIGITPVRSILLQAVRDGIQRKISVFYSNRKPEDSAFLDELMLLEKDRPLIKIIPTMTDMEESGEEWEGERGFINEEMINRYVPDPLGCVFYIVGPPSMVDAMKGLIRRMGIEESFIRTEEFLGY